MKKSTAVAERLKYYRSKCGLTQVQISEMLHIDRSTYTYYERGKTIPSLERIVALADVLNCNYTDLVDDYCKELHKECENR